MIDPSAVAGSSGMRKRKLSSDDEPQETKKVFDFKRNVQLKIQLKEGTYLGEMKRVLVPSFSPSDRKHFVPPIVLDSRSVALKTLNLPLFHIKFSGLDETSDWWKERVEILSKIEACYLKRDNKKGEDSTLTKKDEGGVDTLVKQNSETDIQIVKKVEDVDGFLIEFKDPSKRNIEVFTCGFLSAPKGLSAKQYCVEFLDDGGVAVGKVVAVFFPVTL